MASYTIGNPTRRCRRDFYGNISDDISPQLNILNMVFYCSFVCQPHKAACHPTKCEVIHDIKLFPPGYTFTNFDIIQSDVALQKQVH